METHSYPIIWFLLLGGWYCQGLGNTDENPGAVQEAQQKAIRLPYAHHVTLNSTSPFFLQNIKDIDYATDSQKRDVKYPIQSGKKNLFSHRLQSLVSPFVLTSEGIKNRKCLEDSQTFLKGLNEMDLWALKMYDSSGKFPSGLLSGNVNQFGDFDECLSIDEPELKIKGMYCLAYLQVQGIQSELASPLKLEKALKLLHSHYFFRSKLTDPGHRVPRFSTLNWGLCVPHSCTYADVEFHLKNIVDSFLNGTGFDVEVKVEPEMCQEQKVFKESTSFVIISCLLLSVVMAACLGTIKDVFWPKTNLEKFTTMSVDSFFRCFSLRRNLIALLKLSRTSDDIKAAHGIRMANALMLVLCHKSMALFFIPYSNRTTMVEKLSQPWSIIARIASLYTDSFIMLSGLLTSYSFINTLNKLGKLNLKIEYLNRLIRIIPPLAVIILLSTFVIPELGSGPQWNLAVSHHADTCKKNWWRNLLFVHNYFGFENMCLTHTHHMGIDTQLFFISPILVYALFKWPLYGTCGLTVLAAISTMARYETTVQKNLSFFIYPGITVSRMFDTANYSYIIPFHRLTSYIIGILLGFALRHYDRTFRMKSSYLRFGWTITFTFLFYILTKAYDMNRPDFVYDSREAAIYAALAPIAWCLFMGWIIFVSQLGCGGILGRIMSSKYWLIWTRLSYSVYLTQFPIFFFNVGLQKHSQQYSFFLLVNVLEYLSILVASLVLTLLFDMPFVNLKKVVLPSRCSDRESSKKKDLQSEVGDAVTHSSFGETQKDFASH